MKAARTAEVIANISMSRELAEATYQVTKLFNAGMKVSYDGIDEETGRNAVTLLGCCEYMRELHKAGILSGKTLVNLKGPAKDLELPGSPGTNQPSGSGAGGHGTGTHRAPWPTATLGLAPGGTAPPAG